MSISPNSGLRHVAIIMDGNGRWAQDRSQRRAAGHRAGATTVRRITEAAARLGIEQLTLFAFSTENWKRPSEEVRFLMRLFCRFLRSEEPRLLEEGIRLRAVGRLSELDAQVQSELARVIHTTRGGENLTLCLALNYGGRAEIVDACRNLAARAAAGELDPGAIDEAAFQAALYQPDMPPADLVIRTGGDMRLSNFLLWQLAYAEIYLTSVYWPDFTEDNLLAAIAAYRQRDRRFGGIDPNDSGAPGGSHDTQDRDRHRLQRPLRPRAREGLRASADRRAPRRARR